MQKSSSARVQIILSMIIFGTVGLFVKYIPLPSAAVAAARGVIGVLFLLGVIAGEKQKISLSAVKKNIWWLLLSGAAMGLNWVLLFESYKHTTVATATLCYYTAPVFVVFASALLLREKLTARRIAASAVALCGMVLVSGVWEGGFSGMKGVAFGIGAAMLYATVIIVNKKLSDISSYDKTVIQLGCAAVVVLPYALLDTDLSALSSLTYLQMLLLLTVGIVHTGIAYVMYLGAVEKLPAQTAALLSYIDPVVAVLLSALLLSEPLTLPVIIGAVLILGSSLLSELNFVTKLK